MSCMTASQPVSGICNSTAWQPKRAPKLQTKSVKDLASQAPSKNWPAIEAEERIGSTQSSLVVKTTKQD